MPTTALPDGRKHYVNPFSMLCDRCERRVASDWVEDRCQYQCDGCQRDWEIEHEHPEEVEGHLDGLDAIREAAE